MITARVFSGKRYAVLGLARSGLATVEALVVSGAEVTAWDSSPDAVERLRLSRAKSRGSVSTSLDTNGKLKFEDILTMDLSGFDAVVVSPGVPLNTHPIAAKARDAGVPVIGDIELFAQARAFLPEHKVVGVTGTNGKSTTVALIHHILRTAGINSAMGGNIGLPILAQQPLEPNDKGPGVYVLELSSYQIDLTKTLDCDIAILLNVTPDHLDRYVSFEEYRASKLRLLKMLSGQHLSFVVSDQLYRELADEGHNTNPVVVEDRTTMGNPSLSGPHNEQNTMAARLVCIELDLLPHEIDQGVSTFSGLPHRMERVAEVEGVAYINDSKATNADSAAPALSAYPPDPEPRVHWIVGGQAKEKGLGACEAALSNVAHAYLVGESLEMFETAIAGRVPVTKSETVAQAVRDAAANAKPGDVVLLSPACASFDQFRDFEQRGEVFAEAVRSLEQRR